MTPTAAQAATRSVAPSVALVGADGAQPSSSTAEIRLCGVRHHGPGSARALQRVLARWPPDIVLVEGPPEADAIASLAVDPDMRPPVAMLGHVVDHPERALFAPFASFSPEWIALTWAGSHEVPIRFIDLPLRHALAPPPAADAGTGADAAARGRARPVDPLAELAAAAGYDDAERWWEDVIEQRHHRADEAGTAARERGTRRGDVTDPGAGAHEGYGARSDPSDPSGPSDPSDLLDAFDPFAAFDAIAEAMAAVRAVHEPLGAPADANEARREAAMRTGIRAAVADGFRRILVVCGAWHVPALVGVGGDGDARVARADRALLRGLPKVKVAITWVPWTHRRLASGLGYGAGVTAPGWYHHLFAHAGPDVIARWFTEVARVLRAADHATSAADVVEAIRLADALAAIRGRPLPGLQEVDDVARAVLGGGADTPMRLVSRELVVGTQIGSVPSSTPMVPLARDLLQQQRACRMKPTAMATVLELDLRRPLDLRRSQLLHRLSVLGVPWGVPATGRGTAGTFRETWHLQWEPELDVRLIERSALGTTLLDAAGAALAQQALGTQTLGELTALVEVSLLAGLDATLPGLVALVAERSAVADDVARLLESLPPLARTVRYGDVRGTDATALAGVVHGIVSRIAAGLGVACTGIDDERAQEMARLLREAQSALALLVDGDQLARFHGGVAALVEGPRLPGHLQGLATRLLADGGRLEPADVERRLSRALSRGEEPTRAAAFVEGFLGASGAFLVHDPQLLGLLDGWVATLGADAFADVLPLLRRTFGGFEPGERRAIGERVRTGAAAGSRRGRFDVDPERAAAALATMAELLGVAR